MHTEPRPSNPDVQYEKTDAHTRPLYQFLFWISVITLLTALLSWGILKALESWRERASTPAVMALPQEGQQPPAPRLLTRETLDLAAFQKEEDEILSSYGVVDRDKGIFRIPIEDAIRLTLERGLPVASPSSEPAKAAAK